MLSRGEFDATPNRGDLPGAEETIAALVARAEGNPNKALVLTYIGHLVADGFAMWKMRENGEIELRLNSGETYLLAETTILRLA
jgi:hypothetical protein